MTTGNTVLIAVGAGVAAVIAYIAYDRYYRTREIAGVSVNLNKVKQQASRGVFGVGIAAPQVTL